MPLYQDLVKYEGADLASLLQLRVACFAISTWLTNTSAIKKYIQFCRVRQVPLYLVDLSILNLCVLNLIQERKSQQVIVNLISSVVFASNFLGCSLSTQDKQIKNTLKFVSKICHKPNNQKAGIESKDVQKLWDTIESEGGISKLSLSELRSFVMIVFCHHTLCRFSCSNVLKIDDLLFHKDYFEVHIKFSKTDQAGNGQYSVLPYKKGRYNPHKLMCLYLQVLDCKSNEVLYLFPPLV